MSQSQNPIDANEQASPCSLPSNPEATDVTSTAPASGADILALNEGAGDTGGFASDGDDDFSVMSDFSIITQPNTLSALPPVLHSVQYYSVPATDMIYIAAEEQAREWYVVTRGIFVGVFKYSFLVDQATRKVSSAHGKREESLRDAVDHFNAARNSGWMHISSRPDL